MLVGSVVELRGLRCEVAEIKNDSLGVGSHLLKFVVSLEPIEEGFNLREE